LRDWGWGGGVFTQIYVYLFNYLGSPFASYYCYGRPLFQFIAVCTAASVPIPIRSQPPPPPPLTPTPRIRAGTDQKCSHVFLVSRTFCIPDLSYTGPFEAGPFEAGPFVAGPFEAGPLESGRFVGVPEAPFAFHRKISRLSLFVSDDAPVIYFLVYFFMYLDPQNPGNP
jgi:hypothetical protein